jgi:hypothetical protein
LSATMDTRGRWRRLRRSTAPPARTVDGFGEVEQTRSSAPGAGQQGVRGPAVHGAGETGAKDDAGTREEWCDKAPALTGARRRMRKRENRQGVIVADDQPCGWRMQRTGLGQRRVGCPAPGGPHEHHRGIGRSRCRSGESHEDGNSPMAIGEPSDEHSMPAARAALSAVRGRRGSCCGVHRAGSPPGTAVLLRLPTRRRSSRIVATWSSPGSRGVVRRAGVCNPRACRLAFADLPAGSGPPARMGSTYRWNRRHAAVRRRGCSVTSSGRPRHGSPRRLGGVHG